MSANADRATGAFFAFAGLALYVFVIPVSVEQVASGWLLPQTLPNALVLILAACGIALVLRPGASKLSSGARFLKSALYLAVLAAGLYTMSALGFVATGPAIALVIMLAMGERRPFWIALGVVAVPAVIWVVVVVLLERSLPQGGVDWSTLAPFS